MPVFRASPAAGYPFSGASGKGVEIVDTFFSEELVRSCIATPAEIERAKLNGQKIETETVDGKTTAYIYLGAVYITEITIYPETCKHLRKVFGGFSGSLWQCSDCGAKG